MTEPVIPISALEVLRCQQSLGRLELRNDGLYSSELGITYLVKDGLVFMGTDVNRREKSKEEADRTATGRFDRDATFLAISVEATPAIIRALDNIRPVEPGFRSLQVGAGSGWASYMFARHGYDAWLVGQEPNHLSVSRHFNHPNMGPGKRIVADATLLPFADSTFDVVVCEGFAHHVKDKRALFREANRVLEPGGLLVLFEPAKNVVASVYYALRPDPQHTSHEIVWLHEYLHDLRKAGFGVLARAPYEYREGGQVEVHTKLEGEIKDSDARGGIRALAFGRSDDLFVR